MSKQDDSDTKAFVDRIMKHRKPMTKRGCYEYREAGGEDMLLGYKDGVYDAGAALQKMLKTTKNYDQLKNAVSNFVSQQKELLVYIYDTWPGETVEEYKRNLKEFNASNQQSVVQPEASKPSTS